EKYNWDCVSAFGLTGTCLSWGHLYYYDFLACKDADGLFPCSNISEIIQFFIKFRHSRGDELIKVRSGFAALAIYKTSSVKNVNYNGDPAICEHINLHENMIKQGFDKIYINPNMIILVGVQGYQNKLFSH
ncbi:MAG: hypothetical protein Harvfovirus63_1, partial [Harvfovirus sp.]